MTRGSFCRGRLAAVGMVLAALTAACSSPTSPTPPPDAPALTCPADVTAQSLDGSAVAVNYQLPAAVGGSAPVSVACTPPSGSRFAPGPTTVTCTATDRLARTATCGFAVKVSVPPKLKATKFLAFGDSMTAGEVTNPATIKLVVLPAASYPTRLQQLMAARYVAQSVGMTNAGKPSEWAVDGVTRLAGLLSARPDAVLLMEGVNDLNNRQEAGIPTAAAAMRQMVISARAVGATVFLGTVPAQRTGAQRAYAPEAIAPYNAQLAAVAYETGATLVDIYGAIGNPPPTTLIGADGLHPTEAGYLKIAETFFEQIRAKLELPGVLTSEVASTPLLGRVVPEASGKTLSTPATAGLPIPRKRRD